jgi:quercetin dioxygenase-like cupin family protein
MSETHPTRAGHVHARSFDWQEMGDGTRRKIMGYAPEMLMMRNRFEAGTKGPLHSHPHVQSSYVVSGLFEITIGGVTEQVGPGDGFLVVGGVEHGAHCLEAGEIVEVFTPIRDEFL